MKSWKRHIFAEAIDKFTYFSIKIEKWQPIDVYFVFMISFADDIGPICQKVA